MIRTWHPLYKSVRSCLSVQCISWHKTSNKLKRFAYFWPPVNLRYYSTTVTITPLTRVNMNVFKFLDYDCIGFDLDNTILRYNVTNMVHLMYETLANYLITEKGYDPHYLSRPLEDKDLDFIQKGLVLDFERGNLLRINADGIIQRACHGTKLLSIEKIKEIYPGQRWDATDDFCKDMVSTWNGPVSMKMRSLLDYFDAPSSLIFAKLIDTLDKIQEGPLNSYNVWPDMLDGLIEMFDRDHFELDRGHFFPSLKKNPHKYMHKCTAKTITWLQKLKKHRITFLITGSNADFVDFIASYAIGEEWKSLFDIIICYAKKPAFFTENRPFLQVTNYRENDIVESKNLKRGGLYSQGNWKGLVEFFEYVSGKQNPRCLYVGDNLIQDIYVPNSRVQCDTVAVVEEQMSEGMMHQRLSHLDEKVLNSTLWGSYFCLKDPETNMDSLWGYIIKKHSKLCIPEIDLIAQEPLDKSYLSFSEDGKKYDGYYPAVPLSISAF